MRILVVEDTEVLAESICSLFEAQGHAVDVAHDGEIADSILSSADFDLVILDLNLPDLDGLEVLKRLRDRGSSVPVLILTVRDNDDDLVTGLDLGADDYMFKPFKIPELEARARALLRRGGKMKSPIIEHGPLSFDTISRTVRLDGNELNLTPRERGVLEILLRNHGVAVAKERIAGHLFTFNDEARPSAVELYVHRLRKKIKDPRIHLHTKRGLGYLLECE